MKSYTLECEHCGATLRIQSRKQIYKCEYCDSVLKMPKVIFDELNEADSFLKQSELEAKRQELEQTGLQTFKAHKHFWNIAMIVWLAVTLGLTMTEQSVENEILRNFWPSLFMFGLAYFIASKPRKHFYRKYKSSEVQKKAFQWFKRWKYAFMAWSIVMSVCWGLRTSTALGQAMFNAGMVIIIVGMFVLIKYRPSKYRRTLEDEE